MPRRPPRHVTEIRGTGQVDYTTVWRVFECSRPGCDEFLKISEDTSNFDQITATCPECGHETATSFIHKADRWKYCRVCEWLQPIENFDRHKPNSRSFRSGRQLECKACKKLINLKLNPLRTPDQHREASDKRRLYGLLAGEQKIDAKEIYNRFKSRCFYCNKSLQFTTQGEDKYHLDHTLPARLFWPLHTGPTILCSEHNNAKHEKWPSGFYKEPQLRKLSILTGIPYEVLSGKPKLNPDAIKKLQANIDDFLVRWGAKYPDEVCNVRNLVLEMEGIDIYKNAHFVPDFLR